MTGGFIPDFEKVPFNRFLGIQLGPCDQESAELRLPPREEFRQEVGIVHGGVVSGLADSACVYALRQTVEDGVETFTSIEFKLNFLSAAIPEGEPLTARSKQVKRGRKVGVAEVEVSQDTRLLAKGLFTYLFFMPDSPR